MSYTHWSSHCRQFQYINNHSHYTDVSKSNLLSLSNHWMSISNILGSMERYATIHPPPCPCVMHGDLNIHHYGNKKVQIWLREGDHWIADVVDGHHHPMLPDYRLFIANGTEPTWVTKKTRLTYKGSFHSQQKDPKED
ncbi:hypothetical protein F5J12DRAFT_782002 [Pisolithus orientalis]|uniref:uncharacterized protein n=1 Tax=Pisolithus orientalis TaxID=936130 RepID=UPI002224D285|nr:uncharacterized protein F5J12DRAFT_782002 [Pisolithus orientalis]KAI6009463.1 hypothetical protein F5J12DRAFT_782002 [Pisolithus orientalis]